MNDRPSAAELIAAVRHFLEKELAPAQADQRLRFGALIAANVLGIAGRELATEEAHLREEWAVLAGLLGDEGPAPERLAELRAAVRDQNERLCAAIRAGEHDEPGRWRKLGQALAWLNVRKLEVANPRLLAAAQGRQA
jgi:hypothetical protein